MKMPTLLIIALLVFIPLSQASVQDDIQPKLNELEKEFDFAKYSIFLPITVKVFVSDKNEAFFIKINKDGKFEFLDDAKEDVLIQGSQESLKAVLNSNDLTFRENINLIKVYGKSFKGIVSLLVAEMISNARFNQN